jgi:hypothetical protein
MSLAGPRNLRSPNESSWRARKAQSSCSSYIAAAMFASSLEIMAYCRTLELRWLKLAGWAQKAGGALGHDSSLVATYPVEYGKRAGELIARGARSLTPRNRKTADTTEASTIAVGTCRPRPSNLLDHQYGRTNPISTFRSKAYAFAYPCGSEIP